MLLIGLGAARHAMRLTAPPRFLVPIVFILGWFCHDYFQSRFHSGLILQSRNKSRIKLTEGPQLLAAHLSSTISKSYFKPAWTPIFRESERRYLRAERVSRFCPKIEVAFAFGLFGPETRNDLLQICGIRNKFAHEFEGPERTFDHRVIKAKIDAMGYIKRIAPPSSSDIQPPVDIRGKFIGRNYFYSAQLYGELLTNPQIPFTPKYLP